MIRVVLFLGITGGLALGVVWLADRPGEVAITWQGLRFETSLLVLAAAIGLTAMLSVLVWSFVRVIWLSPTLVARALGERQRRNADRAVKRGLIAIGAGDARAAATFAKQAQRICGQEPLTLLLRAQTAQMFGDRRAAEGVFRAMAAQSDTRLLGLHGLHVEARRRADTAAARYFAEKAAQAAPALPWAAQAVLEFRCADGDWEGALSILETNFANGLLDKPTYERHRAVLVTARALGLEARNPGIAKGLAIEATRLAPDLVPAAALAARLLGEAGETRWATKIMMTAWRKNPHPELADTYAYLRSGDSAVDRLTRMHALARETKDNIEATLALARAALDAREFVLARQTLEPLLVRPTQRVALLMAELEQLEHGDEGRAREWTARAVHAARDPAWTADGFVSDRWLPVSPVSGRIDAFEWKVPLEELSKPTRVIDADGQAAASPSPPIESKWPGAPPPGDEPDHSSTPRHGKSGALPVLSPAAATSSPSSQNTLTRTVEPIIPIVHAPDDPGPGEEAALFEPKVEPVQKDGWRRWRSRFRP